MEGAGPPLGHLWEDCLRRIAELTGPQPSELQAGQEVPVIAVALTMGCAGRCGHGTQKEHTGDRHTRFFPESD